MSEQQPLTRRDVIKTAAVAGAAAEIAPIALSREARAQDRYDAVVIGTGFGGTVATIGLWQKGKKVLLLERGQFYVSPELPGMPPPQNPPQKLPFLAWLKDKSFELWARPDHGRGVVDLIQKMRTPWNRDGLYQYSMFRQAHILTASGVGGGSLIYSNVNFKPNDKVLASLAPRGLRDLDFAKAQAFMVKFRGKWSKIVTKFPLPNVPPEQFQKRPDGKDGPYDYALLDRARVLRDAAAALDKPGAIPGSKWEPLDLSVIEYETPRSDGKPTDSDKAHVFCERQGRCILGCLPGARHTLNKTLYNTVLWDPGTGVTLRTLCEVKTIEQVGDGYRVRYVDTKSGETTDVSAPQVFLAAGTLGSTEILMRSSQTAGLPVSSAVGTRFSSNGDFGALAINTSSAVYTTRGPINLSGVELDFEGQHLTIEDCAIPAMLAPLVRAGLDAVAKGKSFETAFGGLTAVWSAWRDQDHQLLGRLRDLLKSGIDELRSLLGPRNDKMLAAMPAPEDPYQTEAEMLRNVFFFNVMGVDGADGRFTFDRNLDRLDLDWSTPVGQQPVFQKIEAVLRQFTEKMGATYMPLPTWKGLGEPKLIITHPLGGCPIGPTMQEGVVDEFGRVFDQSKQASDPAAVLPGLFVVDGSSIPGSLAANPTLTITAQAIKAVEKALGPLTL